MPVTADWNKLNSPYSRRSHFDSFNRWSRAAGPAKPANSALPSLLRFSPQYTPPKSTLLAGQSTLWLRESICYVTAYRCNFTPIQNFSHYYYYYLPPLSLLGRGDSTLCQSRRHVILNERRTVSFLVACCQFNIHRSGVLTALFWLLRGMAAGATWNCCRR